RRTPTPRAARRAGTAAVPATRSSPLTPPQARRERAQPVALGRERDAPDADRREQPHEVPALLARGLGEALAEAAVARVDPQLETRLRADEPHLGDVREILLPRGAA